MDAAHTVDVDYFEIELLHGTLLALAQSWSQQNAGRCLPPWILVTEVCPAGGVRPRQGGGRQVGAAMREMRCRVPMRRRGKIETYNVDFCATPLLWCSAKKNWLRTRIQSRSVFGTLT